jgi:hypothetical protein
MFFFWVFCQERQNLSGLLFANIAEYCQIIIMAIIVLHVFVLLFINYVVVIEIPALLQ